MGTHPKILDESLTFDDVSLIPTYSAVLPKDVDVSTQLTRTIRLNIPLVSAAMDTVTESRTAISMAQEGGIGIIHRNLPVEDQALEVDRVKKSESGMILNPITMQPEQKIHEAVEIMKKYRISGVPITKSGKLVGILTNRDLRFEKRLDAQISTVMTKDRLITVPVGTTLEEAKDILHRNRIEKLLVVDDHNHLKGLITIKDIEKIRKYPNSCKDHLGRLRVGAGIGIGKDREARTEALIKAGVDVLVIDSAHGHSKDVLEAVLDTKENFPDCQLIGGNVATKEGALDLIKSGVDAIKIGVGPGSICTTRVIAGVGIPQLSAIMEAMEVSEKYGVPLIADGGIKFSGDITKAMAAGAHSVMIGNLFAGTDESPGEIVLYQGRSYKVYRGMGSLEAMKEGSRDRYFQGEVESEAKLVPEGIEGRVPYRGGLSYCIQQLIGGLKAGMGYLGAKSIPELQQKARFIRITSSGLRESHVHDVIITKEAPNYRLE
jgi:IMP dehydrogenase